MENKIIFEEKMICPHCSKGVLIKRIKNVIQEPVKGEYKEFTRIEKDTQKKLSKEVKEED